MARLFYNFNLIVIMREEWRVVTNKNDRLNIYIESLSKVAASRDVSRALR